VQQVEARGSGSPSWALPPVVDHRIYMRQAERQVVAAAGDVAAILLALTVGVVALAPGTGPLVLWSSPWIWSAVLLGAWALLAPAFDAYTSGRIAAPAPSALAAGQAAVATAVAYFLVPYYSAPLLNSRAVMLLFVATMVLGIMLWRIALALALGRLVAPRTVLVVGAGWGGQAIAEAIGQSGPDYRLVGFVDDRQTRDDVPSEPSVLGGRDDLARLVEGLGVTDVVVAEPARMHAELVKAVVRAYESGVYVTPMANLYEQLTGRIPVEHVGDDWIGAMPQIERLQGIGRVVKRSLDVIGGTVGLLALALLTPPIALAIKLDSPGRVFYTQERVGYRGRTFQVRKFRSMVEAAEADGRPRWAKPGDPRVTRVGRFLRATRLDELPQVTNILRGEMSVVGPRPERPEFVAALEDVIPFYRARLLVKPGLTGWAQIKYRYGSSANDALIKLQYDLYYVKHHSLVLDALIIAKTIGVVLGLRGW
jgi:exopolysaccharide biosynthesis polyprenyl glycosylphosphotransferase